MSSFITFVLVTYFIFLLLVYLEDTVVLGLTGTSLIAGVVGTVVIAYALISADIITMEEYKQALPQIVRSGILFVSVVTLAVAHFFLLFRFYDKHISKPEEPKSIIE